MNIILISESVALLQIVTNSILVDHARHLETMKYLLSLFCQVSSPLFPVIISFNHYKEYSISRDLVISE